MEQLENILFEKWGKGRINFCPDGVVDSEKYCQSNPQIMFILKEVNSVDALDLRKFLKGGGRKQTWNNIARWIYGLQNLDKDFSWQEFSQLHAEDQRKNLLKAIIAINLKKSAGSYTANSSELQRIANEDADFLREQFQIYYKDAQTRPDLIIACGTDVSDNFNTIIEIPNSGDWQTTKRGINHYEFSKSKYFIKYIHPEARVSDSFIIFPLLDTVREIYSKSGT